MGHRYKRQPETKVKQKARSDKNKAKPPKLRKFASEEVRQRKLKVKELKRQRYFSKSK